jgi:hypothetical protein
MARNGAGGDAGAAPRRGPSWSCACGMADNWGDRKKCRGCKRDAPASVLRRIREAQDARRNDVASSGGGAGGRGQQRGGGGGGTGSGSGNAGARSGSAARAPSSYAEAARGGDKLAAELAELRRSNERLQRQVDALQAGGAAAPADAEDDEADTKEERIKLLSDNLRAVALVFTESSDEYRAAKLELDNLVKARREGKPLNVQIQRVDKRIDGQRKKLSKAEELCETGRKKVEDARADLAAAEKEVGEAKKLLGELEDERRQLLLRETQAAAQPPGPASTTASENEAWERTMASIQARVQAPGVQADLAMQIGGAVDLLRGLCGRLPAELPAQPVADAPAPAQADESTAAAAPTPTVTPSATSPTPPPAVPPAGPTAADDDDGQSGDEIEVDAEGLEDEPALAGFTAAQKERVREFLGRRRKPATARRLRMGLAATDGNSKKPEKGAE